MKKPEPPKLHILHVATARSWRGGEQQAAYLIGELEKMGINQTILCTRGSAMEAHCQKQRWNFITAKKTSSLSFGFSKTLQTLCIQLDISLCHLHDSHAHTFAILAAVVFGNKTPLVLSRRVDFPIGKSWFSKYKYNHPAVKKIICVSQKICEITAPDIRNKAVLHTIHSGIDLSKFRHSGKLQEELNTAKKLIGNTSALADHKDYFTFIDTAEKVLKNRSDVLFLIFGTGPLQAEIKKYITEKGLNSEILLLGFRKDIPTLLGDLDVFLMTSKTEGLGTSILDAFAAEVPVVATRAGGIPELIEPGKTGLLCDIKDATCLAEAVHELLDSAELRKKLTTAARDKVKAFSKEATAAKTLAIYQEITQSAS